MSSPPLVGPEERVAELARHWLAAGPSYAGRAWRAAVDAAAQARRTFSWVEAEHLMAAAIEAHRRDPLGTPEERIDLLLTRARDCRPNAEWNQVLPCAAEAMALARRAGDLDRLAAAAAAASDNLVWLSQQWDEVLEDTVDDLRWGLHHVPTRRLTPAVPVDARPRGAAVLRPSARAEIIALADEGHAMARRIDDPALLWWACHTAWKSLWAPTHLERRLELGREGLEAARASGDEDSLAIAHLLMAAASLEAGVHRSFVEHVRESERVARRRRNSYALMALGWVHMSLAAMSGDDEATRRHLADVVEYRPRLNPLMETVQVAAAQLIANLWNGRISAMVEPLVEVGAIGHDDMSRGIATLGLARGDRVDMSAHGAVRPAAPRRGDLGLDGHLVRTGRGGSRGRGRGVRRGGRRSPRAPVRPDVDERHLRGDGSGRRLPVARAGGQWAARTRRQPRPTRPEPRPRSGASRRTSTGWSDAASTSDSEAP